MKKQKGITLIALVISIIVMLILAGVSINAIVGENGILSRAQYSSFMNEMAAVEEAVQLWKTGELIESKGQVSTAIPTEGLCKVNDLTSEERLVGEVGYYRSWNIGKNMPDMNILSSAELFNKKFEGEFVYYPAGVQDLYYLNNEALDLDKDKVYLIDAVTSIVYSTTGITLNGVRCYSTSMVKAVMGNNVAPIFAEAETSGGGDNIVYAGETYLKDKNGNYIDENGNIVSEENKVLNPNGFQIIADDTNENIYKLYNNGDLYGKGKKGNLLATSSEEMEELNTYIWNEFSISDEIENSKEIVQGNRTIFIITDNNELYAFGENHYNYLGLTPGEQNEYTGRDIVKLNVNGKKVSKVFPTQIATWVITTENELYVCGYNNYGELGIGKICQQTDKFELVKFDNSHNINPQQIRSITSVADDYKNGATVDYRTIILMKDGSMYFAGNTGKINQSIFTDTDLENNSVLNFTEIFNGKYGNEFENKIIYIGGYGLWGNNYLLMLDESGNLFELTSSGTINVLDTGVQKIMSRVNCSLYTKVDESGNLQYKISPWGTSSVCKSFGINDDTNIWIDITDKLSEKFDITEIKDYFISESSILFLLNNGELYAAGAYVQMGVNKSSGISDGLVLVNDYNHFGNIEELIYINNAGPVSTAGTFMIKDERGILYSTGDALLMFRNLALESKWVKINPEGVKVKKFNAQTYSNSLAFIDTNNDIWVLGDNVTLLGVNHSEDDMDIKQFVLLKDYLKDMEIYNNIDGKVEDYRFGHGAFFIKTNNQDNNTLYACGPYQMYSWPYYSYTGLQEDAFIPTKVLEHVNYFSTSLIVGAIALLDNNELYIWGNNDGSITGGISSTVPILYNEYTYRNQELVASKINKIAIGNKKSYIMTEEEIFGAGLVRVPDTTVGCLNTASIYTKIDKSMYFNSNTVIDVACLSLSGTIFLTENGNLYGCGNKNYLGIGTTSTEQEMTPIALFEDNSVSQIVAGPNWFVIVKKDGSVWGTGLNQYGILGRWAGVGRGDSNSRYKTAFNWVECPELEI